MSKSIKNLDVKWRKLKMKNNNKSDTTIVYTQAVAGYLMFKGFVLKDMQPNIKDKTKNVFFFNYSENLEKAIDNFNNFKTIYNNQIAI
jgi:hypothetical protein